MNRSFERKSDLTLMDDSKLTKRTKQPEMHDRLAKRGVQPVGEFSADKSVAHHEKPKQEEHKEHLKK